MLAAEEGHLPVARLLVETYHCDVNEEDGEVSGWEVMGGVSEYSTVCVRPLSHGPFQTRLNLVFEPWTLHL